MYILTIYRIIDDIDILWQQASANELTLQKAAVTWATENGWEPSDDDAAPEEQFSEVQFWFDNMGESDDPRMLLRRADG